MGAVRAVPTLGETLRDAAATLAAAGVAEPRADAEVLLAHVLGTTRAGLVSAARRPLAAAPAARFAALLARRAAREPVQHLVGRWEFWSLELAVDRRALVPRPETELVVETALRVARAARRVLDLGTGSGCLAVVLARELGSAEVVGVDVSADALELAGVNVARVAPRVHLVRGDLGSAFRAGAFDLVVANPPYCAEVDLAGLAPEVRLHEPRAALAGGPDGLAVVRRLLVTVPRVLGAGGWLVMEIGAGQAGAVRALVAAEAAWSAPVVVRDSAGIERVVATERRGGGGGTTWTRS